MNSKSLNPPPRRKRVLLVLQYYDYRHHAGVARYAAEQGWALEDAYTLVREFPETWEGDGIISFHGPNEQFVQFLKKSNLPVVDIGEYEEYSDFHRVTTDASRITQLAVEHFADRGYKNIGFAWLYENVFKAKRLAALKKAVEARDLAFHDVYLENISQLMPHLPMALLAVNDGTAIRALRACEDAGLKVPEQVAILGVDNFEYRCVPASVPLSSVEACQETIGYEAARMLDQLMQGQAPAQKVVEIPPLHIVARDSTDMRAVSDLQVAIALRFIIQNFKKRIRLNDVSAATTLSLRRLQTRFKEQLGRTILQEINGRRILYAQKLLAESNKKIRVVAAECGFGGSVKLIRVFKQYCSTSPKRYRKQLKALEKP